MKKLILLCFVFAACSSTKTFRKFTREETTSIKKYTKLIDIKDGRYHVLITTSLGDMVVKLYNETPLHRDNFVAKVKAGFYDSLLFHRVINNFMIQGGDPKSKEAKPEEGLGEDLLPVSGFLLSLEPNRVFITSGVCWLQPVTTTRKRQAAIVSFILCSARSGGPHSWTVR